MSVTSTLTQINAQTITYLPAVLAGIQAAESASQAAVAAGGQAPSGTDKLNAVLAGVGAGASQLTGSSNQTVAQISALVSLSVFIYNALGIFKHSTPATAPAH